MIDYAIILYQFVDWRKQVPILRTPYKCSRSGPWQGRPWLHGVRRWKGTRRQSCSTTKSGILDASIVSKPGDKMKTHFWSSSLIPWSAIITDMSKHLQNFFLYVQIVDFLLSPIYFFPMGLHYSSVGISSMTSEFSKVLPVV